MTEILAEDERSSFQRPYIIYKLNQLEQLEQFSLLTIMSS